MLDRDVIELLKSGRVVKIAYGGIVYATVAASVADLTGDGLEYLAPQGEVIAKFENGSFTGPQHDFSSDQTLIIEIERKDHGK